MKQGPYYAIGMAVLCEAVYQSRWQTHDHFTRYEVMPRPIFQMQLVDALKQAYR